MAKFRGIVPLGNTDNVQKTDRDIDETTIKGTKWTKEQES